MAYLVFTGDIIDSSALSPDALVVSLAGIEAAFFNISTWNSVKRHGFRIRGGDGWQAAIDAPAYALRAALYLRATMRALPAESRFAIAAGEGVLPEDGDTNLAHGPAFTASGRSLTDLPKQTSMQWAASGPEGACFALADEIAGSWTAAQARALVLALPPDSKPRIKAAKQLGVSRQAVDQALKGAGFAALTQALNMWEAA